jgi:hypothetical protein
MIPLACAAPTARSTCRMIWTARHGAISPISSTFASGRPFRSSITTNVRPSGAVPMSKISMMCGLPILPAANASRRNRAVASVSSVYFSSISFTATCLPSSMCSAS